MKVCFSFLNREFIAIFFIRLLASSIAVFSIFETDFWKQAQLIAIAGILISASYKKGFVDRKIGKFSDIFFSKRNAFSNADIIILIFATLFIFGKIGFMLVSPN